jgi:hypothetical protein
MELAHYSSRHSKTFFGGKAEPLIKVSSEFPVYFPFFQHFFIQFQAYKFLPNSCFSIQYQHYNHCDYHAYNKYPDVITNLCLIFELPNLLVQPSKFNSYLHLFCRSSRCGRCRPWRDGQPLFAHLYQFIHQHLYQIINPKEETFLPA